MLDESIPLTTNEWAQWGDPREKPYYDAMLAYSPYDNLAARDYPAMLVTTGLWDPMVQYYEPAKYVARLRARKTDRNPLLFHITMEAGHSGSRDASSGSPKWRANTLSSSTLLAFASRVAWTSADSVAYELHSVDPRGIDADARQRRACSGRPDSRCSTVGSRAGSRAATIRRLPPLTASCTL